MKEEELKILHKLKSAVDDEDLHRRLAESIGADETWTKRVSGLDAEDELALILLFLKSCDRLVQIEQGIQAALGDTAAPDFLCHFSEADLAIFLEVKSTDKSQWKISSTDFDRRVRFCDTFNLPLHFAIRLKGMWGLFSADEIRKKNYRVEPQDFVPSLFNQVTGNFLVLFPEGTQITSVYSDREGFGIRNPDFGHLNEWSLSYGNNSITVNREHQESKMICIAMEFLHDLAGKKIERSVNGETTTIIETLPTNVFIRAYHFLTSMITHSSVDGDKRDSTAEYLHRLKNREESMIVNLKLLLTILDAIRNGGIPIILAQ